MISTQPEQVPVLHRYLPAGVVYLTPLGAPADPSMLDWRGALPRLRAGRVASTLLPRLRAELYEVRPQRGRRAPAARASTRARSAAVGHGARALANMASARR